MKSSAIEFVNVGKMYRLGRVGFGSLQHDFNRFWQTKMLRREDPYLRISETNDRTRTGASDYVWALKDISFSVEQGEIVGIIGRNGAGKSTLLKLLSNITAPTTGTITYQGRVASLLEVGTGFHPDLTGRENIYMNGAILGMTRREITQKLDAIVDFAGVERYFDTPVKRYSSGMTVRLGFAVAAFLEPEILVVDEVLSVGDAEFQKKALKKINELSHAEGRTALFVSHNLEAIKHICHRGIVFDKGLLVFDGSAKEAVSFYRNEDIYLHVNSLLDGIKWSVPYIIVDNMMLNGTTGNRSVITCNQDTVELLVEGETTQHLPALDVRLEFRNMDGVIMASLAEGHYRHLTHTFQPGRFRLHKRIFLPEYLAEGNYIMDIVLHQPNVCLYMQALSCALIHVEGGRDPFGDCLLTERDGFFGLIAEDL